MGRRTQGDTLCSSEGRPITDEDIYTMLMLYQYQRLSVAAIARRYRLSVARVRELLGRRLSGSCCG